MGVYMSYKNVSEGIDINKTNKSKKMYALSLLVFSTIYKIFIIIQITQN